MRFFARVLVCVATAVVAACNPINDKRYMDEGAGIELGYATLPETTRQQDIYVQEICQQAGASMPDAEDGARSCLDRAGWNAFVLAGINDINRRCDAYLTWLDARRRDRAPVLKELLAVTGATNSILTASGADTTTLGIVSAATALAGATYENWNSRLLLAINQSTVVDIVYSRQAQFLEQIAGRNVSHRPGAIFILRNYLRLCMPTTIEADINTSATLVQRDLWAAQGSGIVKQVRASLNVSTDYSADAVTQALRAWLRVGGDLGVERRKLLDEYMTVTKKYAPKPQIGTFLSGSLYKADREDFARRQQVIK